MQQPASLLQQPGVAGSFLAKELLSILDNRYKPHNSPISTEDSQSLQPIQPRHFKNLTGGNPTFPQSLRQPGSPG